MDALLNSYRRWSLAAKIIFQAAVSVTLFYGGAILEQKIQNIFAESSPGVWVVRTAFISILLISFVSLGLFLRAKLESLEHREQVRRRQLEFAWNRMDQYVAHQVAIVREEGPEGHEQPHVEYLKRVVTSPTRLMEIVREVYRFFESQYPPEGSLDFVLDFEATFFTKSYLDGELTIPAHANRQGRAPPSLELRKTDRSIYQRTFAAKIYTETRPTMKIIADTMADPQYMDLYSGQREKICSLVVFPVLSDSNTVLGVLVVHCNKGGFFANSDRAFWSELLEIFGKRLALEKARLDWLVNSPVAKDLKIALEKPF